jgi:hypothetical protein
MAVLGALHHLLLASRAGIDELLRVGSGFALRCSSQAALIAFLVCHGLHLIFT